MSDEESFVVLSKSPLNSLRSNHSDNSGLFHVPVNSQNVVEKTDVMNTTTIWKNEICLPSVEKTSIVSNEGKENKSLAASFILGEVDAEALKTSVYSQFPSMSSMEACAADVMKLQNLMAEYVELKNTLSKVNGTMKQFYIKTQQWREESQTMEQNYKEQISQCQNQIAILRNENIELKRELNSKMDDMKIMEECRQKDHNDLLREISAKAAQLANVSAQLEKLEQDQLASFEFIKKNENDNKDKPEYVVRTEHERIVKQLETSMSQLLAENLDLKDMQKRYHEEIDCLKVNLTAAEELLNQSRADINLLKAKDMEKSDSFAQYENDRDRMREEVTLLRQQVEVYSKDFEMERVARQNLAGEKDKLLQDLRALQRKNHSLIEETQKRAEQMSAELATSVASNEPQVSATNMGTSTVDDSLRCPICSKVFSAYSVLSSHVNDCLDKNSD